MVIYAIFPKNEPNKIIYVGKTKNNINKRLSQHIVNARSVFNKKSKKCIKLANAIISLNYNINIKVIEHCDENNWREREKYWISQFINLKNSTLGGEGGVILYGSENNNAKPVLQYDLEGNFIKEWKSRVEAASSLGLSGQDITSCVNLTRVKSIGGYQWLKYVDNYQLKIEPYIKKIVGNKKNSKKVIQLTLDLKKIKTFDSIREAARELGIFRQGINSCLKNKTKTYKGYKWILEANY